MLRRVHGGHLAVVAVLRLRHRVGVDEAEHGSEDRGIHVLDLDARRALLLHVAEELGHEDGGPWGQYSLVRREGLSGSDERHVGSRPLVQELAEVVVQAGGRD